MPSLWVLGKLHAQQIEDHSPFLGIVLGIKLRNLSGFFKLVTLVDDQRRVTTIVDDQFRATAVRPQKCLIRAPPVLFERLALPRKHGHATGILDRATSLLATNNNCRSGVVLRREDVAGDPTHVGTQIYQRLDEHRSLNRHVQAAHNLGTGKRLVFAVAASRLHQPRHLVLSKVDFLAAMFGKGQVRDLVGDALGFCRDVEGVQFGADSFHDDAPG